MQTKQTTNEGLKRAYLITLPADEIAAKVDAEIKKIAPQVKMPGFRPGKVPANLVKKMHGEQLHAQTLNDTIRESVDGLIKNEDLRPAMQPAISLSEGYEEGKDAEITVELEVLPTVEAPSTDGLKLEKLVVPVTDEQLEEAIAGIAGQNKSYKDAAKSKKAAEGHQDAHHDLARRREPRVVVGGADGAEARTDVAQRRQAGRPRRDEVALRVVHLEQLDQDRTDGEQQQDAHDVRERL